MGRASNKKKQRRERPALLEKLKTQTGLLARSAESFDEGYEDQALVLATLLRTLVHDTRRSNSILQLLGIKEQLTWVDTAGPIEPGNLLPDHRLVVISFDGEDGASYRAGLNEMPIKREASFTAWWEEPVMRLEDNRKWNRKQMVLELANKEGGAHVDPELNADYEKIAKEEKLGWLFTDSKTDNAPGPLAGNPIAVSVRQATYELLETMKRNDDVVQGPAAK